MAAIREADACEGTADQPYGTKNMRDIRYCKRRYSTPYFVGIARFGDHDSVGTAELGRQVSTNGFCH